MDTGIGPTLKGAIAALLLTILAATAEASEHTIKFSAQDIATLRQLEKVESLSNASAKLLLTAPVFEILSSPNPVDIAITLTSTDWEGLGSGAKGLQKIKVCRMAEIIEAHLLDATSDRVPTGEAARYFQRLHDGFDKQC